MYMYVYFSRCMCNLRTNIVCHSDPLSLAAFRTSTDRTNYVCDTISRMRGMSMLKGVVHFRIILRPDNVLQTSDCDQWERNVSSTKTNMLLASMTTTEHGIHMPTMPCVSMKPDQDHKHKRNIHVRTRTYIFHT